MECHFDVMVGKAGIEINPLTTIPGENKLKLNFRMEETGFLEISLLEPDGSLVYNFSENIQKGKFSHTVKPRHLEKNEYLMRIAAHGQSKVYDLFM